MVRKKNITLEELAHDIIAEMEKSGEPPLTMEEALTMAQYEVNSNQHCKLYAHSEKATTTAKKKIPTARKPDEDKIYLINRIFKSLCEIPNTLTAEITNPTREIYFTFGGNRYSITLTKKKG